MSRTNEGDTAAREDVLDEMRRSFQIAAIALMMILITVAALIIGQVSASLWVAHGREVGRVAREIRTLSLAREISLRAYQLSGDQTSFGDEISARKELPPLLDSLANITRDNSEQHARAEIIRAGAMRWTGATQPADSLAARTLFARLRSDVRQFLDAEDTLYRRGLQRESNARLGAVVLLLGELLIVAALLRRFRRRILRQTRRIVLQRDEIAIQSQRVKQNNDEVLQTNSELQDQATALEEQQAELEVTLDELRHSEERFRTLVNSMSDIVYTIDTLGRMDGLLGKWVERERIDAAMFLGKNAIEIFGEQFGEVHRDANERALRGENAVYEWSTKSGPEQRFFTTAISPLRDARGKIVGAVGVGRDVTDRHRKEAELTNAQERLRHAQKLEAVGQLAGGVAHDFNNLLTVITAYSDMLSMEMTESDPQREAVLEIRQAASRAAALTKQLLAFSRRQQLQPQAVDLNEVIHGVENLIARLLGPENQLLVQLSPDIDAVLADRGQIEQVLMNLAANARDAMPQPGRFTLTTSRAILDDAGARVAGIAPGVYIMLSARDTGIGMAPETRARLFEPFFTTKAIGKGTGLGLATVYGIVEQSRGHIRVESEPGRGATFTIYLTSMRTQPTPVSLSASPITNTVLLVDDELAVRSAAAKLLRESGYEVLEAGTGEEALQILRSDPSKVGLMLTDMVMPGLSGRELAQIVRKENPRIAIAIMSGFIRESLIQDTTDRPEIAFVEKPFTLLSLTSALREATHNLGKS